MSEEIMAAAELVRLATSLREMREIVEQRDRALEAAHRKIEMSEADSAAWVTFAREAAWQLEHGARCEEIQSDIYEAYDRAIKGSAPGAALLAELDAARAVVAAARSSGNYPTFALTEALAAYDAAVKARQSPNP